MDENGKKRTFLFIPRGPFPSPTRKLARNSCETGKQAKIASGLTSGSSLPQNTATQVLFRMNSFKFTNVSTRFRYYKVYRHYRYRS